MKESWCALFAAGRAIQSAPPTEEALFQQIKRAALQVGQVGVGASHMVGSYLICEPGWKKYTDGWLPFWTTLPEVLATLRQLISCGCDAALSDASAIRIICPAHHSANVTDTVCRRHRSNVYAHVDHLCCVPPFFLCGPPQSAVILGTIVMHLLSELEQS